MADLEDSLARIPGLAGYLGQEQFTQRRNTAELANANQAATLQAHYDGLRKERGLRDALANMPPDATDEQKLQAIMPFVGADNAFKTIEGRRAREAALEQANVFRQMVDDRKREELGLRGREQARREAVTAYRDLPPGAAPQQAAPPPQAAGAPLPAGNNQQAALAALTDPNIGQDDSPAQQSERAAQIARQRAAMTQQGAPAPAVATPAAPPAAAQPTEAPVQPAAPVQGVPGVRGEVQPLTGAPVARGLPTPPPELEAEWAKLPRGGPKGADAKRADWMAKQIGGAALTPEALKVAGWEKLMFGTDPKGLGTASAQQRAQVADERARIGHALGLSDQEIAMLPFDAKTKQKAIGNLVQWGAFVGKAQEQLDKSMDLAIDYAKKMKPDQLQIVNKAILAGKKEFNDPIANAYSLQIQTVRTEYGRLMAGPTSNGMLPVEAMKKGDDLISRGANVPSLLEMKKVMVRDAQITKDSVDHQVSGLRGSIANPQSSGAAGAQGAPVARFETGKIYTDSKGRKAKYLGDGKWEDQ